MIVIHTRMGKPSKGNGGSLRLGQILSLEKGEYIDPEELHPRVNIPAFLGFILYVLKLRYYFLLRRPYLLATTFRRYFNYLNRPEIEGFVTDDTLTTNAALIPIAKYLGIKISILPHNLESLVPTQVSPFTGKTSPDWFLEEIKLFKLCDSIRVIAREEQWMLQCFGVDDVGFLEYEPQLEEAQVSNVVTARASSPKTQFMVLGTAHNPATKLGMEKLIAFLDGQVSDSEINVIGGGTEDLLPTTKNPNIRILGFLSDADITEYYKTAKACLIYQVPTSGALTKIPELLRMGIPIITNEMGSRSYWNLENIYVYSDLQELLQLMKSF